MTPRLYRRRYIPDELVELKDDEVLRADGDVIVTKWKPIRPRADIASGVSCAYIKRGFKISAIYGADGALRRHYCDIIHTEYDAAENAYVLRDLLADVVVGAEGAPRVLDLGELADALERRLITQADAAYALRALDDLLTEIYDGRFERLTAALRADDGRQT